MSKEKEIKITIVDYATFTDYQFQAPSTFFIMSASQDYYFFHTSVRAEAQKAADDMFGQGKYMVKASKLQKTKVKNEAGIYTVTGTSTRRGQKK